MQRLVDQYNNTYHHSIKGKPINADYSALTEKMESNHKVSKFKVNNRVRTIKYKNIFSRNYTENWSWEIFIFDSVLKTNPWTCKLNLIWSRGCNLTPSSWFFLNNSAMVKTLTSAFCNFQLHLIRDSRAKFGFPKFPSLQMLGKTQAGYFWFLDFWWILCKRKLS